MQNILLRINILDLQDCRSTIIFFCNKLIFRSNCNIINIDKEKFREKKSAKKNY